MEHLHIIHGEMAAFEIIKNIDHQYVMSGRDFPMLTSYTASQLFHHFLGFNDFPMVEITTSGQVITQRN